MALLCPLLGLGSCDSGSNESVVELPTPKIALSAGAITTLQAGSAISPITFRNTGGLIGSCTSTPLPEGLSIHAASCRISGIPVAQSEELAYTVTATNASGNSQLQIRLAVSGGVVAPGLALVAVAGVQGNMRSYDSGGAVRIEFNTEGGVDRCSAVRKSDANVGLPDGLSIQPKPQGDGCVIAGSVDSPLQQVAYVVTASNVLGLSSAEVVITIRVPAPGLADLGKRSVVAGQGMIAITFPNSGGAATRCGLVDSNGQASSQSLPMGLSLTLDSQQGTCAITGAPTQAFAMDTYYVRASNLTGDSNGARVDLQVIAAPTQAPMLANLGSLALVVGRALVGAVFSNSGGAVAHCSPNPGSPSLPRGLSFAPTDDSSSCRLQGTPLGVVDQRSYTVLASNGIGPDSTATVDISVVNAPSAAPMLTALDLGALTVGVEITNGAMMNSGGAPLTCAIKQGTTALPAGINVGISSDGASCLIHGTPEAPAGVDSYTVVASNGVGTESEASASLSVNPAAPNLPDAPVASQGLVGQSLTTVTLSNSGGAAQSCHFLDPADGAERASLMVGLSVAVASNGSECRVDGAISRAGSHSFTVRARNVTGSDDATVNFTITAPQLNFANATTRASATRTTAIPETSLALNAGSAGSISCALVDAFNSQTALSDSRGLNIAPSTDTANPACVLTGALTGTTDTGMDAEDSFFIHASGGGANAWATFILTTTPRLPMLPQTWAAPAGARGGAYEQNVPTDSGGDAITMCDFEDPADSSALLPTRFGLRLDARSGACVLSGVPDTAGTLSLTVVGANSAGSDSVDVSLEVAQTYLPSLMAPAQAVIMLMVGDDLDSKPIDLDNTNTDPRASILANSCEFTTSTAPFTTRSSQVEAGITVRTDAAGNRCQIVGQANAVASFNIGVRASSTDGAGAPVVLMVQITAVPLVFTSTGRSLEAARGQALTEITLATTGPAIGANGCVFVDAVNSQAPAANTYGFTLAVSTDAAAPGCVLGGTPMASRTDGVSETVDLVVRAFNADSEAWLPLRIGVIPPAPELPPGPLSVSSSVGASIDETITAAAGGPVSDCHFLDASSGSAQRVSSLHGLNASSAASGCSITGAIAAAGNYTVRLEAVNDGGGDTVEITFTIVLLAPILADTDDITRRVGESIDIDLDNTGGAPADDGSGCTAMPALPMGLQFVVSGDQQSCRLHGTPGAFKVGEVYTLTATNASGPSSIMVNITILMMPPQMNPTITLLPPTAGRTDFRVGETFIVEIPQTGGGSVIRCQLTTSDGASLSGALLGLSAYSNMAHTSCVIEGSVSAAGDYTLSLEASNSGGSATSAVSLSVVEPPTPRLAAPPSDQLTIHVGDDLGASPIAITNANTDTAAAVIANSCALLDADRSTPLVMQMVHGIGIGTDVTNNRCLLTGSPAQIGDHTLLVRAASSAGNSEPLTLTITVLPMPPEFANSMATATVERTAALAMPLALPTMGGAIGANSCEFVDALNSSTALADSRGLAVAVSTGNTGCEISGTLTGVPDNGMNTVVTFFVRAFNDGGSGWATVTITSQPREPNLPSQLSWNDVAAGVDQNRLIAGTGDATTACFFDSPTNPGTRQSGIYGLGIAAEGNGCRVTGSIGVANVYPPATVTAVNDAGEDILVLRITVVPDERPVLGQPTGTLTGLRLGDIPNITLSNTNMSRDGDIDSDGCQLVSVEGSMVLDPQSRAGITIRTNVFNDSCVLGGRINTLGTITVMVRARSLAGYGEPLSFDLMVANIAPVFLNVLAQTLTRGQSLDLVLRTRYNNLSANGCSQVATVGLPGPPDNNRGLEVAVSTESTMPGCRVTGVPTLESPSATSENLEYFFRASNEVGDASVTLNITLQPQPPNLSDGESRQATSGVAVMWSIQNLGDPLHTCNFLDHDDGNAEVATLGGLTISIDSGECRITGSISMSRNFTIRGTNDGGMDETTLMVTVVIPVPSLVTPSAQSYGVGEDVNLTLRNTGGSPEAGSTGCTVMPALPTGLSIGHSDDNASCAITGAPTTPSAAGDYVVTATNGMGSSPATVNITVLGTVPAFATPDPLVLTVKEPVDVLFPNIGPEAGGAGNVIHCRAVDALPAGLTILRPPGMMDGCWLFGQPRMPSEQAEYRVTADNMFGNTTLRLTITVNAPPLAAPQLTAPAAQSLSLGEELTLPIGNTGGGSLFALDQLPIPGCRSVPALPMGLALSLSGDESKCIISGTPAAVQAATMYEITATNASGGDSVNVSIEVTRELATFDDPPALEFYVGQSVAMDFANTNADSGRVTACLGAAPLPDGLTITALAEPLNGCRLQGMPQSAVAAADHTITVTVAHGNSDLVLNIAVRQPHAPVLGIDAPPMALSVNQAVTTPIVISNSATAAGAAIAANSCGFRDGSGMASMPLASPIGLTIATGDNQCEIGGTPDTVGSTTVFIVATSIEGASNILELAIDVTEVVPMISLPGGTALSFITGESMDVEFENSGGAITNCSADPVLPASLSIDATSCAISGSVDSPITTPAMHEIVPSNAAGTGNRLAITISASQAPAPALVAGAFESAYPAGSAISNILFTNTRTEAYSAITACDLLDATPTLPPALMLNAVGNTCVISGTPMAATAAQDYSIIANNSAGVDSEPAVIRFAIGPPLPAFGAAPMAQTITRGAAITATTLSTGADSSLTACAFVDALNSDSALDDSRGLAVAVATPNSDGCLVSGSPVAARADGSGETQSWFVRAANSSGAAWTMLSITINPPAPDLPDDHSITANTAEDINSLVMNSGGPASSCFFNDVANGNAMATQLNGLSITAEAMGCRITGEAGMVTAGVLTVDAHNDGGDDSSSVTVSITAPPPALSNPGAQSFGVGQAVDLALANSGGAPADDACTTTPALPTGLGFDLSEDGLSCAISGAATAASAAQDYRLSASNDGGGSDITVSIAVLDTVPAFAAPDPLIVRPNVAVSTTFDNTNGADGRVTACNAVDDLPLGLMIAARAMPDDGCLLSGQTATPSDAANYRITASNANGSTTLRLNITVADIPPAPMVAEATHRIELVRGSAIDDYTVATSGGAVTACLFVDALNSDTAAANTSGVMVAVGAGNLGCVVSGTPTATETGGSSETFDLFLMAGNDSGMSWATVSIAIDPPAPTFDAAAHDIDAVRGGAIADYTAGTGGGPLLGCALVDALSSDTAVPDARGMAVAPTAGNDGCVVSGTPTATETGGSSETLDLFVMASNGGGSDWATVSIAIDPPAPTFDMAAHDIEAERDEPIADYTAGTGGGPLLGCALVDALSSDTAVPDARGMAVAPTAGNDGCVVSGTPTATETGGSSETLDLFVKASNGGGSDWATVSIAIDPPAPTFDAASHDIEAERGEAIADYTAGTGGGPLLGCALVDALSSDTAVANARGMAVAPTAGNDGCVVSGTPTATETGGSSETLDLFVMASNGGGSDWATVSIAIDPPAPTFDAASYNTPAVRRNEAIADYTAGTGGGPLLGCALVDALSSDTAVPDARGMAVAPTAGNDGCVVSGTPTATETGASSETLNLFIMASNDAGSAWATVSIAIDPPMTAFAQAMRSIDLVRGAAFGLASLSVDGIPINSCALVDALDSTMPAADTAGMMVALSMDNDACVLSGNPPSMRTDGMSESLTLYVLATSDVNMAWASVTINIIPERPSFENTSHTINSVRGMLVNDYEIEAKDGPLVSCQLVSARDSTTAAANNRGMDVAVNGDNDACLLRGTPEGMETGSASETLGLFVMGGNDGGMSWARVDIIIAPAAPQFADDTPSARVTRGEDIGDEMLTVQGGPVGSCTFVDALDSETTATATRGLSLSVAQPNANACVVAGTPTTALSGAAADEFSLFVRAANDGGDDWATLTVSVVPPAPIFALEMSETLILKEEEALADELLALGAASVPISGCDIVAANGGEVAVDDARGISVSLSTDPARPGCVASGTPEVTGPSDGERELINLVIRGYNDGGSDWTVLRLRVDPLPTRFAASQSRFYVNVDEDFTLSVPIDPNGGAARLCRLSVPDSDSFMDTVSGVSAAIGEGSCQLSGSFSGPGDNFFDLWALNDVGTNTARVQITVEASPAAPDLADPGDLLFTMGTQGSFPITNNGGGQLRSCTAPGLPAGLSAVVSDDRSQCLVEGTATAVSALAEYTFTATNYISSDMVDVGISVVAAQPSPPGDGPGRVGDIVLDSDSAAMPPLLIAPQEPLGILFGQVYAGADLYIGSAQGAVAECAIYPHLPSGLAIEAGEGSDDIPSHCRIVGSALPGTPISLEYTIEASNAAGSHSINVAIEATDPPEETDDSGALGSDGG